MVDELFYLQNARQHVGNAMLWWAKDGQGYVCDIRQAHVFSRDDALKHHRERSTDRPWPKAYIDERIKHHIDMQYCDWNAVKKHVEEPSVNAI